MFNKTNTKENTMELIKKLEAIGIRNWVIERPIFYNGEMIYGCCVTVKSNPFNRKALILLGFQG